MGAARFLRAIAALALVMLAGQRPSGLVRASDGMTAVQAPLRPLGGEGLPREQQHHPVVDQPLRLLEQLVALASRPKQPLEVLQWLPPARPAQPWPYRPVGSALSMSVVLTETHALVARVEHAPLPGVTAAQLRWWFAEGLSGEATYPGDGKAWDKYLMWHPRDHIRQETTGGGAPGGAPEAFTICEFILCPEPQGYTAATWPGAAAAAAAGARAIRVATEVKRLDGGGLRMALPSRSGLGETFWHLRHDWRDSPEGARVTSTQVVGVAERGWRPLGFARLRNAVVRGLYGRGADPRAQLEDWIQHCVEEVGNWEHFLPSVYAEAHHSVHAKAQSTPAPGPGQAPGGSRGDFTAAPPHSDEL